MSITEHLSPAQIRSIATCDRRVNLWTGSIRSGKTVASLIAWLIFVSHAPKGGALVVIGRTRDSIARNLFVPLTDPELFGSFSMYVKYNAGAPSATIFGRTVYVIGASDARAELVLRGLTVAGAYVDEGTLISEAFWTQLLGRMSVPGARLFATTNPDNPAHWMKKMVVDRAVELGYRLYHFTLADNTHLDPDYVKQISQEFTGLWHRRFILGEWVAAEGAIYSMWDEAKHVVPWDELPKMKRLLSVGLDYGTTHPTSAIMLGLGVDRKLYLVDEWRYDPAVTNQRLTDSQLAEGFLAWLNEKHIPQDTGVRLERVCIDPAAASLKMQLYASGFNGLEDADNAVSYGIKTVASLLSSGQLLVSDRCTGWIQEVTGYSWDDKATKAGKDAPIKVADDSMDAGRYAILSTETAWRSEWIDPIALNVIGQPYTEQPFTAADVIY